MAHKLLFIIPGIIISVGILVHLFGAHHRRMAYRRHFFKRKAVDCFVRIVSRKLNLDKTQKMKMKSVIAELKKHKAGVQESNP